MMPLLAGIVFSCVREPEAPLSDGQIPQETYAPDDEGVLKGWVRIKLRDDAQALPLRSELPRCAGCSMKADGSPNAVGNSAFISGTT